jgi:uncharacterized membrane protein (UPF0182 family)
VLATRKRGPLLPTIIALVVLGVLAIIAARLWVDVLWYQAAGYTNVFTTVLGVRVLLFVVVGALTGAAVFASLSLGYRMRPVYAPVSPEQASLDRYREQIEPLRRLGTIVVPAAVGLIAGAAASEKWSVFLLWRNGSSFGVKDPQFHKDVGFFVFTLPFLHFVLSVLTAAVVLSVIAAVVTHYLYGGLRLQGGGERTTNAARIHLSILIGLFVLMRGAGYWLDRYSLTTSSHTLADGFTGMTYTDVNAALPAKMFLAIAAVVIGLLARVVALKMGAPQLVVAVPAALILLPGLTIFRSMYVLTIEESEILLGAGGMLNAGAIVLGTAAGIVLGDTLARPLTRSLASNERRRARRRYNPAQIFPA